MVMEMKLKIGEYKKSELTIYVVLRILVIITMISQLLRGNFENVFMCILTLILFLVPIFVDKKLNIKLPTVFESIVLLFIFAAEILGEVQNFYGIFKGWDTILHTINGFLCAAIGFSLIDILNRSHKFHAKLSPFFVALVSFCFSMTIGVLWEFFEFGADTILKYDMQKDRIASSISTVYLEPEGKNKPVIINDIEKTVIYSYDDSGDIIETTIEGGYLDIGLVDTMKDLIVNFVGAVFFSIIGMLYIKNRDGYKFAEYFMPILKTEQEIEETKQELERLEQKLKEKKEERKLKNKNKKSNSNN